MLHHRNGKMQPKNREVELLMKMNGMRQKRVRSVFLRYITKGRKRKIVLSGDLYIHRMKKKLPNLVVALVLSIKNNRNRVS